MLHSYAQVRMIVLLNVLTLVLTFTEHSTTARTSRLIALVDRQNHAAVMDGHIYPAPMAAHNVSGLYAPLVVLSLH